MKNKLRIISITLCLALSLTFMTPADYVRADEIGVDSGDGIVQMQTEDMPEEPGDDSGEEPSAQETVKQSKVKKAYIVANKKARINWTKSAGADGYILYRRTSGSESWKRIAILYGEDQTYGYDAKVAQKTYYYTVKAFRKVDGKSIYADMDEKGFKVSFHKNTVKSVTGDYKAKSVYGPSLSAAKLSEVKSAVQKFCNQYITSDMSDVEKVLAAQLYLAGNCTYAADWSKNGANTAWGALVYKNSKGYHEAQCSGFARGMKALCDGMGVECRYVHANAKSYNPSHQWVEVRIDKKWYIVDPQANATSGFLAFFLCSGSTYTNQTGMTWDKGSYPKVSGKDYSYEKINDAWYGYKVTQVYNKIFK